MGFSVAFNLLANADHYADAHAIRGETNTVCGLIASTKYAVGAAGNPTYLNFDRPYPHQSCSVVIAEARRAKFKVAPETAFWGKWVCVTGVITMDYRGKAQIAVSDPAQIVVEDTPTPSASN
ncbi:MAG: DNA-binding protein [Verrucomicrobiia bacterium]